MSRNCIGGIVAGQVGGRTTVYEGLTFSTVRAAGHMVRSCLELYSCEVGSFTMARVSSECPRGRLRSLKVVPFCSE